MSLRDDINYIETMDASTLFAAVAYCMVEGGPVPPMLWERLKKLTSLDYIEELHDE